MERVRGFPRTAIKYTDPKLNVNVLRHKVEIYVPINDENQARVARKTFELFCEYFGGATGTQVDRGWIDGSRALIRDRIVIIHSFVPSIGKGLKELVTREARRIKEALKEDAITVVYDNQAVFI